MTQTRLRTLRNRNNNSEAIEQDRERVVIFGDLSIDYNCFKKTQRDRELLKLAKWNSKKDAS